MKQLIINRYDIYKVNDTEYFKFTYGGLTYRDIYTNLSKNDIWTLKRIAIVCELNSNGLNKKNLIDLIENSNCLTIKD